MSPSRGISVDFRNRTALVRDFSASRGNLKKLPSRGISGVFRNPTALVRVFSDSRGNLKKLPSRGIFMSRSRGIFISRSRGIFLSPSRGISGDFRNPTALVRVFSSSRGNLKRLPPQRDFSHFPSGALMAIKANISSRGIFHIYPLELSWHQPTEGFFTLRSGGLNVLSIDPLVDYFHFTSEVFFHIFPLEVLLFNFSSRGFHDGFGNTSTVFSSYNSPRGYLTRFSSGRGYLQILQSF